MLNGLFRHAWSPSLGPSCYLLRAQQFTNLRHFRPFSRSARVVARAAAPAVTQRKDKALTQPVFTEFRQLGLSPDLVVATHENGLAEPTEIQAAAIPGVLSGGDVLLASHTGSGKTLAYLLPLVHKLRQQEGQGRASKPKRPRALVLGPTRELTDQILQVAKSLSHHARFRSACVNGGGTHAQQAAALATPLDILVATPQKLLQHAEKGNVYYGDVQYVVLDEADTMFDRGFGPEVESVLGPLRSKPEPAQCILVAATLTKPIRKLLEEKFPDMKRIETQSLHKGVAGARHTFLPQTAGQDKLALLLQVVAGEQRRGHKVMVFCNTLDSCRAADKYLQEQGLPSLSYHGDVPLDGRRQAIQQFAQGTQSDALSTNGSGSSKQPVLVCTDLAARGLDIPGDVDHVVNFDFPYNPVDYLHRTGRTARAGKRGRVTSLVAKGDQVLAGRIDQALQQGLPMDELSADRKSLPPNMRPKPETLKRRSLQRKVNTTKGIRGAARFGRTSTSTTVTTSSKRGASTKPTFSSKTSSSSASKRTNQTGLFGGRTSSSGSNTKGPFKLFDKTGSSSNSKFGRNAGAGQDKSRSSMSFGKFGKPDQGSAAGPARGQSGKSLGKTGSFGKFGKSHMAKPGKKRGLGSHKSFK